MNDPPASDPTVLSVTLLRLAVAGKVAEPVADVLRPADAGWRATLGRLLAVGSSSGLACAVAIGASALLLSSPTGAT